MKRKKQRRKQFSHNRYGVVMVLLMLAGASIGSAHMFLFADAAERIVGEPINPNVGVETKVRDFFMANDAPEMIEIIACESEFKHYEDDGTILKNREGSSAVGVAQILTSKHPDPRALKKYNRQHNTDLSVADFDIMTLDGNLGYALLLYEIRGTRDWECGKHFGFAH